MDPTKHRVPHRPLTEHETRAVAVKAMASPHTVRRWLRGDPIRDMSRARIEKAASILGLLDGPEKSK